MQPASKFAHSGARLNPRAIRRASAVAALLLAAAVLPLIMGDFRAFEFGTVACVAIVLLGLNLLTGSTGLISVGHGALMGVGAYTTAILVHHFSLPYLLAVPAASILGALLGAVIGLPALRLRGLYLGLVTLSLAIALPPVLKRFKNLTGGPLGITPRPPNLIVDGLTGSQSSYLVALITLVGVIAGSRYLHRSTFGRRLAAVKASEAMAATCGIPIAQTKIVAFAISSLIASAGGGLFLTVVGTVTPDSFTVILSITLLTSAVVGGLHSAAGAVAGGIFFVFVPSVTAGLADQAPQIVYALALLLTIYFMPGGIAAIPERIKAVLPGTFRWRRQTSTALRTHNSLNEPRNKETR